MTLKEQLNTWYTLFENYIKTEEFQELGKFLSLRRNSFDVRVFPEKNDIFRAFRECPLNELKIVFIGYEPYKRDCANGLAFGYNGDGRLPKTANNLYRRWELDIWDGLDLMYDYSHTKLANKGCLFLNLSLTVDNKQSHALEWRLFTTFLLKELAKLDVKFIILDERTKGCMKLLDGKAMIYTKLQKTEMFKDLESLTNIKFKT